MASDPDYPSDKRPVRPEKAYKNLGFLSSPDARTIRMLCEYHEPLARLQRLGVENAICFYGSARARPSEETAPQVEEARRCIATQPTREAQEAYDIAVRMHAMSGYYDDARELARRLTAWSLERTRPCEQFYICTGGGPGIMQAANHGAELAGGKSIGLNISLPFEQEPNPHQSPEFAFEFHYFFMRKLWFVHLARAVVVFPGGFGTFDELFELLCLVQTLKVQKPLPIVIYGARFWDEVVDFDALASWGMISPTDTDLFRRCDDVDSAFAFLTTFLTEHYLQQPAG